MKCEAGESTELERAIARFETATTRHSRQRAAAEASEPTPQRLQWSRSVLAVAAAVLSTSVTAVVLSEPDRVTVPAEPVTTRAVADGPSRTAAQPQGRLIVVQPDRSPTVAHPSEGLIATWPGGSQTEAPQDAVADPVPRHTTAAGPAGLVQTRRPVERPTEKPETVAPVIRFVRLAPPTTADDIPLVVRRALVEAGTPAGAPGDADSAAGRAPIVLTDAPLVATRTPPPLLVPHHGVMADTAGVPLAGRISTIFSVYREQAGGIPFWVSLKAVETDVDGRYMVMLGETATLPEDLLETGTPPWLGVQPDGQDERPRVRLTGLPCALPAQGVGPPARLPTTALLRVPEIRPFSVTAWAADTPCPRPAPVVSLTTGTAAPLPMPYRGVLSDTTGAPLVGLVSAIFAFYEEVAGGIPLWVDIQTLDTGAAGGYTVLLGGTTALPADLFTTGAPRWLGVQADGEAEQPRVEFAAPALLR